MFASGARPCRASGSYLSKKKRSVFCFKKRIFCSLCPFWQSLQIRHALPFHWLPRLHAPLLRCSGATIIRWRLNQSIVFTFTSRRRRHRSLPISRRWRFLRFSNFLPYCSNLLMIFQFLYLRASAFLRVCLAGPLAFAGARFRSLLLIATGVQVIRKEPLSPDDQFMFFSPQRCHLECTIFIIVVRKLHNPFGYIYNMLSVTENNCLCSLRVVMLSSSNEVFPLWLRCQET